MTLLSMLWCVIVTTAMALIDNTLHFNTLTFASIITKENNTRRKPLQPLMQHIGDILNSKQTKLSVFRSICDTWLHYWWCRTILLLHELYFDICHFQIGSCLISRGQGSKRGKPPCMCTVLPSAIPISPFYRITEYPILHQTSINE